MKSIMMSIKPKWYALILNGIKKGEVRKGTALYKAINKLIEQYGYAEIYMYCTKGKPNLWLPYEYDCFELDEASQPYLSDKPILDVDTKINGKVVAKFRCYKAVPIVMQKGAETGYGNNGYVGYGHCEKGNFKFLFDMEKETCLEHNELCKYLNNGKNFDDIYINKLKANDGCAIHISDLEIFDRPKRLDNFERYGSWRLYQKTCPKALQGRCNHGKGHRIGHCIKAELTKAPQSWCYIETEE